MAAGNSARIPGASRAFVRPLSNKTQYGKGIDLGNTDLELPELESGHGNFTGGNGQSIPASNIPKSSTFFFPLPYNDEQISVVMGFALVFRQKWVRPGSHSYLRSPQYRAFRRGYFAI